VYSMYNTYGMYSTVCKVLYVTVCTICVCGVGRVFQPTDEAAARSAYQQQHRTRASARCVDRFHKQTMRLSVA